MQKELTYRNDQADSLRERCAKDERRAKKAKAPVHLRKRQKREKTMKTLGLESVHFVSPTPKRRKESFTFDDFPAVSEVCSTSLSVCGADETRTPSTFYVIPVSEPAAVSCRQQPPPTHSVSRSRTDII